MHAEVIYEETSAAARGSHNGIPRWAEVLLAFVALVIALPLIALLGLAIAVFSQGPIFFRQKRVGQHGRLFDLYKLCTMRPSDEGPQVTSSNDERITPLGRFLRRSKLDELPTFWNVLKGDMALVGPRPEVPRYVKLEDPIWQAVLAVRPGLTDPVTLRLRNEEELLAGIKSDTESYYVNQLQPLKLKGYVAYLQERTWRSDFEVLGQTLVKIATGSGVKKPSN
jgi:lipopolysaccharide/colanic/teichoic acid biosynthesis glycosyltransferase